MTDFMEAGARIERAYTALQFVDVSKENKPITPKSGTTLGRFYAGFGRVKPLHIPILLAAILPLAGCGQLPCEPYPFWAWCSWSADTTQKHQRVLPPPRLRNPVKTKSNPVG